MLERGPSALKCLTLNVILTFSLPVGAPSSDCSLELLSELVGGSGSVLGSRDCNWILIQILRVIIELGKCFLPDNQNYHTSREVSELLMVLEQERICRSQIAYQIFVFVHCQTYSGTLSKLFERWHHKAVDYLIRKSVAYQRWVRKLFFLSLFGNAAWDHK